MKNYRSIFPFLFVLTLVVAAVRVRAERVPKALGAREQALVQAVMAKDTPAILSLLKAGADPNTEYSYQAPTAADPLEYETRTNPLLYHVLGWYTGGFCWDALRHYERSIFDCDLSVVKAFLDAGADADPGRKGSLLAFAAQHSDPAVVALLFKHGADANAVDKYGTSVLAWAATFHNVEGIQLLLVRRGKRPVTDTRDQPALLAAIDTPCYDPPKDPTRQIDTVRLLLAVTMRRNACIAVLTETRF